MQSPEYDFMAEAEKRHVECGYDFPQTFDFFFSCGYVFKSTDYLLLGCEDAVDPDAWLIWYADLHPRLRQGDPVYLVKVFFRCMPWWKEKIAWRRQLHHDEGLRYYSTERIRRLTSVPRSSIRDAPPK